MAQVRGIDGRDCKRPRRFLCDVTWAQSSASSATEMGPRDQDGMECSSLPSCLEGEKEEEKVLVPSLLAEEMFFQLITMKSQMKYKPHELFGLLGIQESFSVWTGSPRLLTEAHISCRGTPFLMIMGDHPTPPLLPFHSLLLIWGSFGCSQ